MTILPWFFILLAPVGVALVSTHYKPAPIPVAEPPAAFVQEINEIERMPANEK